MSDKSSFLQLLIAYHKPGVLVDNEICTPVHIGRAMSETKDGFVDPQEEAWLRANMIGDDTGDNISRFAGQFNELVLHYWAWKNYQAIGNPEYVGFMHYRRHFLFGTADAIPYGDNKRNAYDLADADYMAEADFTEKTGKMFLANIDAVFLRPSVAPSGAFSAEKHIRSMVDGYCPRIWEEFRDALGGKDGKYAAATEKYLPSRTVYWHNMFIMRRELFFRYAEWFFGIFADPRFGFFDPDTPQNRTAAYLGEWLTGIFVTWLQSAGMNVGTIRHANLRRVGTIEHLRPMSREKNLVVAIFLDDNGIPYFATCLAALAANIPEGTHLDILVADTGLSNSSKKRLQSEVPENADIRLFEMDYHIGNNDEFQTCGYAVAEMYAKLRLPEALAHFDKLLLVDSTFVDWARDSDFILMDPGDSLAVPFSVKSAMGGKAVPSGEALGYGALFMNLRKMREMDFSGKCMARLGKERTGEAIADAVAKVLWEEEKIPAPSSPSIWQIRPWNRAAVNFSPRFWEYAAKTMSYSAIFERFLPEERAVLPEPKAPSGEYATVRYRQYARYNSFIDYRAVNRHDELVLTATGPTLERYRPIPGAVHLGVNRAFERTDARFDYYMISQYGAIGYDMPSENMFDRVVAACPSAAIFCPMSAVFESMLILGAMEVAAKKHGIKIVFNQSRTYEAIHTCPMFNHELDGKFLAIGGSGAAISILAMQFALYTEPKRIYLVGCDGTGQGPGATPPDLLARSAADWLEMRDFAKRYYPDTEIVSINPVRLKGLFRDMYT